MTAIQIYNTPELFDKLITLSAGHINMAKNDRTYLTRFSSPKWFLAEIYGYLKKRGDLPELTQERKKEIWKEAKGDKLLAFSLYLIEVI